ncbi:MAG: HAD family hydrolase [DPANN group archaeon]|nr:HAD family hydrolase [DPANN group archaeon]
MTNPKAVLFDVDGTILDLHGVVSAMQKACVRIGVREITKDEIYKHIIGKSVESGFKQILPDSADKAEEFRKAYHAAYKDTTLNLLPGANETLSELKNKGIKAAFVTTRTKEINDIFIDKIPLPVDVVVTKDDVNVIKPDPAPILMACDKLNVKPEEAWFVGDHEFDMQGARNAGCGKAIGITTGTHRKEELIRAGANIVIQKLTDLLRYIE